MLLYKHVFSCTPNRHSICRPNGKAMEFLLGGYCHDVLYWRGWAGTWTAGRSLIALEAVKLKKKWVRSKAMGWFLWLHFRTKSIARAQTSAALNLRNVKQSSQAYNSIPQNVLECSLLHVGAILKTLLRSVEEFSIMLPTANRRTDWQAEIKTLSFRSAEVTGV